MTNFVQIFILFFVASWAADTRVPNCLGKLCFGGEYQLRKDIPALLSISGKNLPKSGNLCFRTKSGNFLLIRFFDQYPDMKDMIETVYLTKANVCGKTPVQKEIVLDFRLMEKIAIGDQAGGLEPEIGKPKYFQTGDKLKQYSIDTDTKKINPIDDVRMYVTDKENELLCTRVFLYKKNSRL